MPFPVARVFAIMRRVLPNPGAVHTRRSTASGVRGGTHHAYPTPGKRERIGRKAQDTT
ncbi:hypothetical protein BEI_2837 [Halomonas beimenensis]|uniref:Uncharacterized protein n=1 Tax=Halomonas beimenensis TaxID=475662 RepID=A0A291PAB0_9GAMM|nr:hypothetical protein BEI_2837 [Halomonas beimenensis]